MASIQDIRRRIRSVKNTQQVTKAMKMISAVKLRKSQERLVSLRPYANKLLDVVQSVVSRVSEDESLPKGPLAQAFLAPREEKRIRLLVIASDKGLCGGFNSYLLKQADAFVAERGSDPEVEIVQIDVVGKRANDWARKSGLKVTGDYHGLTLPAFAKTASEIAGSAARQYQADEIDALYVIYNYFHSAVNQTPEVVKLFPAAIDTETPSGISPAGAGQVAHLLEPDAHTVLEALLPQFVETELLRCLLESSASEHGARMSAMDKASSNASEMIDKLTLHMNKIRQASITNQIIEIVSGANA
jgi:F-type H+-transporting ATPase subunit gamma